ncbi:MAG: hypothetical protein NTX14_00995 [Candidatus Nealsonbacteria bacterium]|nr:hypothetical protein [Candidatus Nealsonbacteria bacterium]
MIIEKIKAANLRGRGGAGYPTAAKWEMVMNAPGETKYVICNVSEGEPAEVFEETGGYLGGEETTLLEVIEGKRAEPRFKPPYPPQSGLYLCPTLINNLETFYSVARIAAGQYKGTRFYTISGDVKNSGVYELAEDRPINKVLEETGNLPDFEFFVQAGGGASGQILLQSELDAPLSGAGSIVVYSKKKTDLAGLMKKWTLFFIKENCGKCVPCREGVYRLNEMLLFKSFDVKAALEITAVLKETSFCPFGKGVANSFESLINKLWNQDK